jgi:hypothetical protein
MYVDPGDGFDPFLGDPIQTNRLKAWCKVEFGGVDITHRLDPHLIAVRIVDRSLPTCEIEIDDRDGRLPIPPFNAPVVVQLGWENEGGATVFRGRQQDLEYGFARQGGGRRMWVHAYGADMYSKIKEPDSDNMGEGAPDGQDQGETKSASDWIQHFTSKGGAQANLSGGASGLFGSIMHDFWEQNNESPMHLVSTLMEKYGALHRWHDGNQVDIFMPGEGGGDVVAEWGHNLISLRVRPLAARGSWTGSQQRHYSMLSANWKRIGKMFNFQDPWSQTLANYILPATAPNAAQAGADNEGTGERTSNSAMGHGRIVINGEPKAKYGSLCQLIGVRPGVDGTYIMWDAVEHVYSRAGYITNLDVVVKVTAAASKNVGTAYQDSVAAGKAMAEAAAGLNVGAIAASLAEQAATLGEPIDSGVAATMLPQFSEPPPPEAPIPLPSMPEGGVFFQ